MSQLDLLVPGLFGPFSADIPAFLPIELKQDVFSTLSRCLSRANVSEVSARGYYNSLQAHIIPQCDTLLSQVTARAAGLSVADNAFLYRADPVHFKAESDHAILLGPELLALETSESQLYIEQFNQHFADDHLMLLLDQAGHWYLQTERALKLDFRSLDESLGRDIKHFLPQGDDELWWRRILNEAQMLFFQMPGNDHREAHGQLSVNGMWLWDYRFEFSTSVRTYERVFSDHQLAKDMLQYAKQTYDVQTLIQPMNEFFSQKDFTGNTLMLDDSLYASVCYGDINAWLEALEIFCQNVFNPLYAMLCEGQFKTLNVFGADGRQFSINRAQAFRLWRSIKTPEQFLISSSEMTE